MDAMHTLNIVLWGVQGFLALFFLAAGAPKLLGRGLDGWTGFSDLPRGQVVFTGFAEVMGAAGLVLPMATGVLPWITPLAAVGLAITMLLASGFHVRGGEHLNAVETGLWGGIAAAVAVGRWHLLTFHAPTLAWVLVAALGLMVPATVINVVVLMRRSLEGASDAAQGDGYGQSRTRRGHPASA